MIIFLILVLLSVLTAQSVPFAINAQAQPITAASPFEQLEQQQQPQLEQPQQQQTPQSQQQGLQEQQPQQQTPKQQDVVLLSARLNDDGFGGQQIVGEVRNSGTEPAEFVQPFATFRDAQGAVVDTAFTYAEKQRITSGDTSPFNLFIVSEVVKQQAKTYDLGLEWQDQQGNEFTSDVLSNQPFIPGAVSATSISRSSSGGGGGEDDNNREPCIVNPSPGINETVPGPPSSYPPCPPGEMPPGPTPPPDNQTEPEPTPIECGEGFSSNPSTGQCEPVSALTLPGDEEQQQNPALPSPPPGGSGNGNDGDSEGGEEESGDGDEGGNGDGGEDDSGGSSDEGL